MAEEAVKVVQVPQTDEVFPRLIATLQVGPYPIDVYEQSEPLDDEDSEGEFNAKVNPWRITIAARNQGRQRWAVILHELTHVAFNVINVVLPEDTEETVCDAIALTLAEALASFLPEPPRSITNVVVSTADEPG